MHSLFEPLLLWCLPLAIQFPAVLPTLFALAARVVVDVTESAESRVLWSLAQHGQETCEFPQAIADLNWDWCAPIHVPAVMLRSRTTVNGIRPRRVSF